MKALLQGGTEINIKAEFFILFYFIIILKLSYASRKVYISHYCMGQFTQC